MCSLGRGEKLVVVRFVRRALELQFHHLISWEMTFIIINIYLKENNDEEIIERDNNAI
jgi:hypothetical protein